MMPVARFQMPDGRVARFEVPAGTTPEQAQAMMGDFFKGQPEAAQAPSPQEPPMLDSIVHAAGNLLAGAARGAGSIGSTILAPADMINDALAGKGLSLESNRQRRADIDRGLQIMGADPDSGLYKTGKIATEIAGTMPVGGLMAKPLAAAPRLAEAVASGGMAAKGSPLAQALLRAGGGAASGAATAAMVNPEEAASGAAYGAAFPMIARGAGALTSKIGSALRGGPVSPEIAALYQKSKQYGIDVPADRLANSRPLNALAATLNYVPFSGRAATEDAMTKQLARAISKTMGQDSPNLTQAWRTAKTELGSKFDDYLQNNPMPVDSDFIGKWRDILSRAKSALSHDDFRILQNQVMVLGGKAKGGVVDGQAAYNIKKDLGQIGKRLSNEATYANDLKRAMVDAWDRAGDDSFRELRKQYGNMKTLKGLVQNGAEGEVSAARVGNLRDVRDPELQELADISHDFLKGREGQHGAAQRFFLGLLGAGGGAGLGMLPAVAGGAAAGRVANKALNSEAVKNLMLDGVSPQLIKMLRGGEQIGKTAIPVLTAQ